jgi:peptidoglycan/xylan/chitin deacetylase (PgdA/CDA1 family)
MDIGLKLTALCIGICILLALAVPGFGQTSTADGARRCWSPEALAGSAGEKAIRRAPYDPSIEPRERAVTLPPLPRGKRGSIRSVKLLHGEKLVAFTFDLCENAGEISGYDAEIVDTLRRLGVKATFFPSGKWLLDHRDRAQQLLADPLFQVGGHSWTHRNFRLLPADEVRADLALDLSADAEARRDLSAKACFRPDVSKQRDLHHATLFRFPFGTCNAESLAAVNDAGLLAIQWNVVSGDPAPAQSAEAIRRGVAASIKPGSIVIMHANGRGRHTAEALPLLIADLRERGFDFATVGELLEKGEPIIADSCYELKPGDNARYDKLFPLERPIGARSSAAASSRTAPANPTPDGLPRGMAN